MMLLRPSIEVFVQAQTLSTATTTTTSTSKTATRTPHELKTNVSVIRAQPRMALFDEKIKIELANLPSNEKITLHGECLVGNSEAVFGSCGHYVSDDRGQIKVSDQSSIGGTYTGIEPMGILWSLQVTPGYPQSSRMTKKSTDIPSLVDLKAYPGHLLLEDIYTRPSKPESLAGLQLERWMRFPSELTRVKVNSGKLRGAFYIPSGDGPFQGVIDMAGVTGGIFEHRAALLASHGFAALALPYFRYEGLPTDMRELTLDYFEDAITWVLSHPRVHSHGVGVLGSSKGCELAYCMGAYLPQVKCVVGINGCSYVNLHDLRHEGKLLLKGYDADNSLFRRTADGNLITWPGLLPPDNADHVIPAWRGNTKYLLLMSDNDLMVAADNYKKLLQACPREKEQNFELVTYPGAGHVLDPPYMPLCSVAFIPFLNSCVLFGGQRQQHAHAQEDSWVRTLQYLRTHIPTS